MPAFPVDERWVVDAVFQPYVEPAGSRSARSSTGLSHFPSAVGDVLFTVEGQQQRLVALAGKDGGLALHFRDATSGVSTYGGGRILRTGEPGPEGELTLDLNRTVNLPCAFTEFATCPLPPVRQRPHRGDRGGGAAADAAVSGQAQAPPDIAAERERKPAVPATMSRRTSALLRPVASTVGPSARATCLSTDTVKRGSWR